MYQVELMSPEHEALRLSILQDAVSVIRLIKNDVYHGEVYLMMLNFLDQEETMEACLQGDVVGQALGREWVTIYQPV
jgi:hypothetical protein